MGSRHIYLEFHDTVKLKILDILIVFCLLGLCFYIQAMRNNCNCFFSISAHSFLACDHANLMKTVSVKPFGLSV